MKLNIKFKDTKRKILIFSIFLVIIFIISKLIKTDSSKFIIDIIEKTTDVRFVDKKDLLKVPDEDIKNVIIVNNESMFGKIATGGQIGFAESYMDKDWDSFDLENIISKLLLKKGKILDMVMMNSINLIMMQVYFYIKSLFSNNTINEIIIKK